MRLGRLRIKAAEIVSKLFGVDVRPESIQPVTGYWKGVDVYRWECSFANGDGRSVSLGCWETLAVFVRDAKNGISLHRVHDVQSREIAPGDARGAVEIAAHEADPMLQHVGKKYIGTLNGKATILKAIGITKAGNVLLFGRKTVPRDNFVEFLKTAKEPTQ